MTHKELAKLIQKVLDKDSVGTGFVAMRALIRIQTAFEYAKNDKEAVEHAIRQLKASGLTT